MIQNLVLILYRKRNTMTQNLKKLLTISRVRVLETHNIIVCSFPALGVFNNYFKNGKEHTNLNRESTRCE